MALHRSLIVACLKVPNLDGGVLRGADHDAEDGVKHDPGDGGPVPGELILFWRPGDPFAGGTLLSCRRPRNKLLLRLGQLGLELIYLKCWHPI